jgi:hypothetical protein
MKTITLTGMDEVDLNKKQWDWQTTGPAKKIIKQWPDEHLPMRVRHQTPGMKLDKFPDQYLRRLDYKD